MLALDEKVRPKHIRMAAKQRYAQDILDAIDRLTPKAGIDAAQRSEMFDGMTQALRDFYDTRGHAARAPRRRVW